MIREIVKDPIFLSQPSQPATRDDAAVAQDLLQTLVFHREECVGMAANMIGVRKRIIVFDNMGVYTVMFNPQIVSHTGDYEAQEGCLSLQGTRSAKRYREICVRYENMMFLPCKQTFSGFAAQIIQHEIDHCNGVLI